MSLSEEVAGAVESKCLHCRDKGEKWNSPPVCEGCPTPTLPARIAALEAENVELREKYCGWCRLGQMSGSKGHTCEECRINPAGTWEGK